MPLETQTLPTLLAHLQRGNSREEAMGVTTVFSASGVDKKKFLKHIGENTATYRDWSRTWPQTTTGRG